MLTPLKCSMYTQLQYGMKVSTYTKMSTYKHQGMSSYMLHFLVEKKKILIGYGLAKATCFIIFDFSRNKHMYKMQRYQGTTRINNKIASKEAFLGIWQVWTVENGLSTENQNGRSVHQSPKNASWDRHLRDYLQYYKGNFILIQGRCYSMFHGMTITRKWKGQ